MYSNFSPIPFAPLNALPKHASTSLVTLPDAAVRAYGLDIADALFVHMYLSDMEDFAAANRVYGSHFPASNPAARACVQAVLPPDVKVAVDVIFARGEPFPHFLCGLSMQRTAARHSYSSHIFLCNAQTNKNMTHA